MVTASPARSRLRAVERQGLRPTCGTCPLRVVDPAVLDEDHRVVVLDGAEQEPLAVGGRSPASPP